MTLVTIPDLKENSMANADQQLLEEIVPRRSRSGLRPRQPRLHIYMHRARDMQSGGTHSWSEIYWTVH